MDIGRPTLHFHRRPVCIHPYRTEVKIAAFPCGDYFNLQHCFYFGSFVSNSVHVLIQLSGLNTYIIIYIYPVRELTICSQTIRTENNYKMF